MFRLDQAAKGALLLHRSGSVHLDLKSANLIVGKKFLVKVCDFESPFCRTNTTLGFFFAVSEKYEIYSLRVTVFRCLLAQNVWASW